MIHTHPFPAFLIAIEGIDGAGKTTQAHFVQSYLQGKRKLPVVRTKEPTTGHWGQILRDSAVTGRLSIEEEVEAFIKDRQEHVRKTILPALELGQIVIIDRYYFSTMAYQGARGISIPELMRRNEEFAPEPDLLVILDIDPKFGLERIRTRGDRANHFEQTNTLKRAREIFLSIDKPYRLLLDAMLPTEELTDKIVAKYTAAAAHKVYQTVEGAEGMVNSARKILGYGPVTRE